MEFRILGPLEVSDEGGAIALGAAKQRALLAILLLHRNQVVSAERLIDELWGERPPETAPKGLQVYVSGLRRALGPELLRTHAPGYVLEVEPGRLDLDRFEQLVSQAREADPTTASDLLREALALWRGPPLADLAYEPFAQAEAAQLEDRRLAALEDRIAADLDLGRHTEVVGELERLTARHPLRERPRGQLMLALYRSGRQAEALDAYRDARRVLVDELGIEPSRSLQDLQRGILEQDPALELAVKAPVEEDQFVGRERELDELSGALGRALAGSGAIVLFAGEPGIGKSRLADRLARQAGRRGLKVLWGRCWEAGGAPAYWPWVQVLRSYARDREATSLRSELGAGAAELAQLLPELRERFADVPALAPADDEGARFRLFDATVAFVRNAALAQPLLVIIDDLHAADAPSLLLLRFLASELAGIPALVVGCYRDVELGRDHPLSHAVAELERGLAARVLRLGGLVPAEIERLVELRLDSAAPPGVVAAIERRTRGNPLFVGEVCRLLEAEPAAIEDEDALARRMAMPRGVRDAIGHRLDRLAPEVRELLRLGSAFGREFSLDALAALRDVPVDQLYRQLDQAVLDGIVEGVPAGAGRLRFSHVLIRDALYEAMAPSERARLHRRIGETLEQLYSPDPEPYLAELAHQFFSAAPAAGPDKAITYAVRAGDRAAGLLAFEEAGRLYQSALRALESREPVDDRARCDLLLALGEVQTRAGEGAAARESFVRAADIARDRGLPEHLARAALGVGTRFVWPRAHGDTVMVALLQEALDALGERDNALAARVMARLACALRPARESAPLAHDAVEMARRLGDDETLAYALDGRYGAIWLPDSVHERLAVAAELKRVADCTGNRERRASAHFGLLLAHLELADMPHALRDLADLVAVARDTRQPAQVWYATAMRALVALIQGRYDAARRLAEETFDVGGGHHQVTASLCFLLQSYLIEREAGDLGGLEEDIERCADEQMTWYPTLQCVVADLYIQLGRESEARRLLERVAAGRFAALPRDNLWLVGLTVLADVCDQLDDPVRAAELYDLLVPFEGHVAIFGPEACTGPVSRALGVLATTLKRWEAAAAHFDRALATCSAMGARGWSAHAAHQYGRMLLESGSGEQDRAMAMLTQAVTTYRELGMERWAKDASGLLPDAAGRSAPFSP